MPKKKPGGKKTVKRTAKKKRAKPAPKTLADLAADKANPRKITDRAAGGLASSLHTFGDLSGIVYNVRTGELVAGHQRVEQLRAAHGDVKITGDRMITPAGDTFAIRLVDWDRKRQRAANITANSPAISGAFTDTLDELLDQVHSDSPELFDEMLLDDLRNTPAGGDVVPDEVEVPPVFQVVVECTDEGEQRRAYEYVQKGKFKCRVSTL